MKLFVRFSLVAAALFSVGFSSCLLAQSSPQSSPQVEFNSEKATPRSVEDLTSQSVPRDYAFAWQNMAQALEENRPALLDAYFTGQARIGLTQRIKQQTSAGLHAHYSDQGHKLTVLFYSPNGDAMQLQDDAQLEVQIFDGGKIIQTQPLHLRYMVLMTPGADRWMVRELEAVPSSSSHD